MLTQSQEGQEISTVDERIIMPQRGKGRDLAQHEHFTGAMLRTRSAVRPAVPSDVDTLDTVGVAGNRSERLVSSAATPVSFSASGVIAGGPGALLGVSLEEVAGKITRVRFRGNNANGNVILSTVVAENGCIVIPTTQNGLNFDTLYVEVVTGGGIVVGSAWLASVE